MQLVRCLLGCSNFGKFGFARVTAIMCDLNVLNVILSSDKLCHNILRDIGFGTILSYADRLGNSIDPWIYWPVSRKVWVLLNVNTFLA